MSSAKQSLKNPTKTTTRKPQVKKASAKKASTTKKLNRSTKAYQPRSFRVCQESQDFMSFKLTRDTVYWLILGVVVLAQGIWTINIHQKVQAIYDEIEQSNLQQQQLDEREIDILRDKKARQIQ